MSDVERWLQNHVSEGSEEDDIVSKEEMWKSFSCKSDIKVGRQLFFKLPWVGAISFGVQECGSDYQKVPASAVI